MIGKTLGHYRILQKIGAGGMGEVYRAHDVHLERDVAIKVLPTGTLSDEGARQRFRQEALLLSKLNHPNIATIHDFDTQDGIDFLVMEYVAGPTLSQKRDALSENEIAAAGEQIASALEEAHEHGIIHRDLKPGNVIVTPKGQLKVLDFGLAKLLHPLNDEAPTAALSQTQHAAGTLPYMAPEQLRGTPVDGRADIHALGVILYELSTGRRPFDAKLPTALAADIQTSPPAPPRSHNARLSTELERIILKCLEKEPGDRYQSAREVAIDLRRLRMPSSAAAKPSPLVRRSRIWLSIGAAAAIVIVALVAFNMGGVAERLRGVGTRPTIQSLAVLPLRNLSGDPEQDYFAEGMTESLITDLSKIGALTVISRTSAMRYKSTDKPLPLIAKELHVDAVVEGSVQRYGSRVKITAQLIHAATDKHLWAESYERDQQDVLALQSEVARAIANEIRIKVTPQERTRLASVRSVNPDVHEAYLKGRFYLNKYQREQINKAIGFFEQAIAKDKVYAPAHAGLADSYAALRRPGIGQSSPKDAMPKAREAARNALAIDDTLAEAHISLADVHWGYEWDWAAAANEFKRALELDPGNARAHSSYGTYLSALGQHEESIKEFQRALEINPLDLNINSDLGFRFYVARRYDEAAVQFRKVIDLDPSLPDPHTGMIWVYEATDRFADSLNEMLKSPGLASEEAARLRKAFAMAGWRGVVQEHIKSLKGSPRGYLSPYLLACQYVSLGDLLEAFALLEQAYRDRDDWMVWMKVDPHMDSVRSDARFKDLVRRMNFPQ
jgi:serine/threonine protein kinase/Tfp pilus assembly protein PilF